MFSFWLVLTCQPTRFLVESSVASRRHFDLERLDYQSVTCHWLSGAFLVLCMSLWSYSLISFCTGRLFFFFLALVSPKRISELYGLPYWPCRPRGWKFVPIIIAETQNPLVHDPRFKEFTIPLWLEIELSCCSPLSEHSRRTCHGWNSIILRFLISSQITISFLD